MSQEEEVARKNGEYDSDAQYHFAKFMEEIGLPAESSEHLKETPRRVTHAFRDDLFSGLDKDPDRHLQTTFNDVEQYKGDAGFVIVRDIQVQSCCAHHWLPFVGKAHVGYLPKDDVVGLSKIARVTEEYARRPQVQERLTNQIATAVHDNLDPIATFVILEAEHECMSCRGIRDPDSSTITSARRGDPDDDSIFELEKKFYQLVNMGQL